MLASVLRIADNHIFAIVRKIDVQNFRGAIVDADRGARDKLAAGIKFLGIGIAIPEDVRKATAESEQVSL